jgi:hypothetical protein
MNAPFIALTGYEVSPVFIKSIGQFVYDVTDNDGDRETFATVTEALCYAENVDRVIDLSEEALAYSKGKTLGYMTYFNAIA